MTVPAFVFTNPLSIAGCVGWYDASNAGSITSSGGLVSQWNDLSGNGHHYVQSNSTFKPETGTLTQNSKNLLDFSVHNTRTSAMGWNSGTLNAPLTYIWIMLPYAGGGTVLMHQTSSWWAGYQPSGTPYFIQSSGIFDPNPAFPLGGAPQVFAERFSPTSTDMCRFLDGIKYPGTSGGGTTSATDMQIGSSDGHETLFSVGEVCIYNSVLSDSDIAYVMTYLKTKWAVPDLPFALTIPGLAGWLDASDTASIVASGGAVSRWIDKSRNNRYVEQTTGANQPITGSRTINGLNALDFNGTSHYMGSSGNRAHSGLITVVMVLQTDNPAVGFSRAWFRPSGNSPPYMGTASSQWDTSGIVAGGTPNTGPHVLAAQLATAGSLRLDGAVLGTGNLDATNASDSVTGYLGIQPAILGGYWDGLVGELLIYDPGLTTVTLQSLEAALKTKWGTP